MKIQDHVLQQQLLDFQKSMKPNLQPLQPDEIEEKPRMSNNIALNRVSLNPLDNLEQANLFKQASKRVPKKFQGASLQK